MLVAEVPGIDRSDLDVQVKGRTVRLSGTKSVEVSRKQPACIGGNGWRAGSTVGTLPVEIDPDGVTAECRDGMLALTLPRAERVQATFHQSVEVWKNRLKFGDWLNFGGYHVGFTGTGCP